MIAGAVFKAMVMAGSMAVVSAFGLSVVHAISSGQAAKTELGFTSEIANRNAQQAKIANALAVEKSAIEQQARESKARSERKVETLIARLEMIETDGIECPENCFIPPSLLR